MARLLAASLVLVSLAFLAGRWSAAGEEGGDAEPPVVRAEHYRIVWADSALDLSHGGGRWVDEFFFPDFGVAATVVHEVDYGPDHEVLMRPRLHVWPAEAPRTDLTGFWRSETEAPQVPTDVPVPAELAEAVKAFAALSATYRAEGQALGGRFASALGLKPIEDPVRRDAVPAPAQGGVHEK